MSGYCWDMALVNRVKNYMEQGYGTEDIVAFLGKKDREIIVNAIRKVREKQ